MESLLQEEAAARETVERECEASKAAAAEAGRDLEGIARERDDLVGRLQELEALLDDQEHSKVNWQGLTSGLCCF